MGLGYGVAKQVIKSNKRACAQLASKSAELTKSISEEVHTREGIVDDRLRRAIESLEMQALHFVSGALVFNGTFSVYSKK